MVKLLPFEKFEDIYTKVPRLCVDIIIRGDDGVLLAKRDITPAKGMWHIPGGTVLWGETNKQAVKRIAKKELSLEVAAFSPLGIIEYSPKHAFGQSTSIVYVVAVLGGILKGSKEGKEVKFFKKIPKNTIPEQAEFLSEKFGFKYEK